jgi:K+-transporting ATPase A subunit
MYSLTISLCYELKEISNKKDKNWNLYVNNFFRFIMDNFEAELVIMGVRLALTQYELPMNPDDIESFDEFNSKYGKFIAASQTR